MIMERTGLSPHEPIGAEGPFGGTTLDGVEAVSGTMQTQGVARGLQSRHEP